MSQRNLLVLLGLGLGVTLIVSLTIPLYLPWLKQQRAEAARIEYSTQVRGASEMIQTLGSVDAYLRYLAIVCASEHAQRCQ